jgi:hypothetical protein
MLYVQITIAQIHKTIVLSDRSYIHSRFLHDTLGLKRQLKPNGFGGFQQKPGRSGSSGRPVPRKPTCYLRNAVSVWFFQFINRFLLVLKTAHYCTSF